MGTPRHLTRSLAVLLLCLFLAALASSALAATRPASTFVHSSQPQAAQFWNPKRMRQALPLSAPPIGPRRLESAGVPTSSAPPGGEVTIPTETIDDPTAPVFRENGAIFIVGPFGALGRCSGTSVNAPNFSLVITAGHCVHEGRHWQGKKWVFVPGYHYGERPFGTFVAKWLGSTPQWLDSENSNFDVGAAVVSRNERGQRLADAVGGTGIAWNLPARQVFDIYGYPVAPPFDGATLKHCPQTPFEGHAFFSFLTPGPLNLAVQCEISPGASGGGWIIAGNKLNGVTTDGFPSDNTDYGPYFGKAVQGSMKLPVRFRGAFAFTVALAVLAVTPGAASAKEDFDLSFKLPASKGYEVTVGGYDSTAFISAVKHDHAHHSYGVSTYIARGKVSPTAIHASFGPLGEAAMRFQPSGKITHSKRHRHCVGPNRYTIHFGVFVGSVRFRGEDGYTSAKASRVKGKEITPRLLLCLDTFFEQIRQESRTRSRETRAKLTRLEAGLRAGLTATDFSATERGGKAAFFAESEQSLGALAVFRAVLVHASPATFAFDSALSSAGVTPPPPFSGSASFQRGSKGAKSWTGSLAASFPGDPDVPLVDPRFRTQLTRSW